MFSPRKGIIFALFWTVLNSCLGLFWDLDFISMLKYEEMNSRFGDTEVLCCGVPFVITLLLIFEFSLFVSSAISNAFVELEG